MKKIYTFLSSLLLASLVACNPMTGTSKTQSNEAQGPVAELDGQAISQKELDKKIAGALRSLDMQVYEIKKQGLESLIQEKLIEKEAKKRGISPEALMKTEVQDKVGEIPEADMKAIYEQNKARIGKSFDEVKELIRKQLSARQAAVYQQAFLERLKGEAKIKILLEVPRVEVSVDDDPMKGNKNASVTIIEFTDYQCPYCSRGRPIVKQIIESYGDKIRYVLRDFPLEFHGFAVKAAEAAQCAGDQGKYWEYGDLLWQHQDKLDISDLKQYAGELALDKGKFEDCLDKGKYTEEVKKDQAAGSEAGVSGTPSFFINGRMLTGAQPFEQFKEIIDEELKTAKQ